jgi:HD-GYP domain-containing protein (c-di-GMP phosphodiesterase class II)
MAGSVGLSQALSYARDLKSLYETSRARERELERAQERLRHAYAQSRQYAVDLRKTYRRLQHAIFQSLLGLANALEAKDPYTRGHSERVATLARRVALAAGVSPSGADTIAQAGLLHDLGKIGIPEHVLRKPGPLDAAEWAVMRRHPIVGAQIVAGGKVEGVVRELIRLLEIAEQNLSFDEEQPMLCLSADGRPLPPDYTMAQAGVRDGARLLLL